MLSLVLLARLASRNLACIRWVELTTISSRVACRALQGVHLSQESMSLFVIRQEGMSRCTNES